MHANVQKIGVLVDDRHKQTELKFWQKFWIQVGLLSFKKIREIDKD